MTNRKKIAVLFSGRGSNFAHIVEHLHNKEIEVVFALTNNPDAKGISVAQNNGIPYGVVEPKNFDSREAYDATVVTTLNRYEPDLTVLAGFMRILTPIFTDQIKAINLHPSLLPRHKGLKAIEKSYADEHGEGGVSVHYVSSELDGGELILQKSLAKEGLSFEAYDEKIRSIEKEALREAIIQVAKENPKGLK
ncbi:MAG: Phosphoribosylglycinamide formyltransferase (EC [uncultured Sulfurovum sp.]|uniref:Phosphoribosylglycinamide formyltransferase n=1 Tax=uncultured Sulfurovum sp. TaxID=269237 RepID=A0A6S6SSW8_9BACT|nr:MAG: Phosphoribosylglycinamide formyltransferase (EC [uncultured Sulfurovum sp.]